MNCNSKSCMQIYILTLNYVEPSKRLRTILIPSMFCSVLLVNRKESENTDGDCSFFPFINRTGFDIAIALQGWHCNTSDSATLSTTFRSKMKEAKKILSTIFC